MRNTVEYTTSEIHVVSEEPQWQCSVCYCGKLQNTLIVEWIWAGRLSRLHTSSCFIHALNKKYFSYVLVLNVNYQCMYLNFTETQLQLRQESILNR